MTTSDPSDPQRRFLPLFVTQLLNAFNDNLFKNAMVLFVVYQRLQFGRGRGAVQRAGLGHLHPALLPAVGTGGAAGRHARQGASSSAVVKFCEIGIMLVGGAGLVLAWKGIAVHTLAIPLMLLALFAMGVHSTFFGPIKYAILPQHLQG
jgi:hypothetical protein